MRKAHIFEVLSMPSGVAVLQGIVKSIHKTHRRMCMRTTQLVTNPNVSPLFGAAGDSVWESAR